MEVPRSSFVSFDYDAGVIGLRLGDYFANDVFYGGYFAFGPRIYFKKDQEPANDLKGWYFKPMLLGNVFGFENKEYVYTGGGHTLDIAKATDISLALISCIGHQFILQDIMVFDLWFGFGYTGGWLIYSNDFAEQAYQYLDNGAAFKYSFVRFGSSALCFDTGISIGIPIYGRDEGQ